MVQKAHIINVDNGNLIVSRTMKEQKRTLYKIIGYTWRKTMSASSQSFRCKVSLCKLIL